MAVNQKLLTEIFGAGILDWLEGIPSCQHGSFFWFFFFNLYFKNTGWKVLTNPKFGKPHSSLFLFSSVPLFHTHMGVHTNTSSRLSGSCPLSWGQPSNLGQFLSSWLYSEPSRVFVPFHWKSFTLSTCLNFTYTSCETRTSSWWSFPWFSELKLISPVNS